MQLTFLGTGAGMPGPERNVTAMALKCTESGALWLFDCGEGTQHQFMRSGLKPGKLEKIFITHLHGDHLFGLPGLLSSRSMSGVTSPIQLYGPKGIKTFIETTLSLSASFLTFPLEITEITGGELFDDGSMRVTAGVMNHVIECYGYRIEEHDQPGALDAHKLQAEGVRPGPWMQQLKQGKQITLDDGRVIDGRQYLGPTIRGRSVAICGDTAPADSIVALAASVDVLVHEATLEASMAEKANSRGHATTVQAASTARQAAAKKLIITHFSSRYDADDVQRLLAESQAIFPGTLLAHDFAVFDL